VFRQDERRLFRPRIFLTNPFRYGVQLGGGLPKLDTGL
jgi:hypothetical protein